VKAWRIMLAAAGISLGLFGIHRLVTEIPLSSLVALGVWLLAARLIHDGLLSPAWSAWVLCCDASSPTGDAATCRPRCSWGHW
jgi:hypothetical protein